MNRRALLTGAALLAAPAAAAQKYPTGIKQRLHNPDICVISYINRLCSAFLNRFSGLLVPDNSLRCLL